MAVQRAQAMTKERWGQIKAAFEAALGQPAEKREECVRILCRQDSELEAEVRALLEANDSAGSFLHKPAVAVIGCPPEGFPHTLAAGEVLAGRFEILRFLNSGGMGEVYEAWDRELQEHIALKTIRPEIAFSPAVLERFKQEVRRARGISHANVCRVYDLFNHPQASGQGIWFLTMELLRGQTLAEWLRKNGPIKPERALELVRQMVAGLAAAHELEIVHRDFKTGNVMLVDAGKDKLRAVITDFGLALNVGEDGLSAPGSSGTPDYMAPEQSRGEPVGVSADQFALGVIMCEMLAGRRPERAGSQAILPAEHHFPHAWGAVIRRCLQTRPQDRFAGVAEVISVLAPQRRPKTWWIAATVLGALTVAVLTGMVGRGSADRVQDAVEVTGETDLSTDASLSRDGKTLAYISDRAGAGRSDIWVQHLPVAGAPVRVATGATPDKFISISPDGSAVVFRSEREGGGVYLANTAGGGEKLLAPGGRDPRFSPDGLRILYWKGDRDESVPSGQLYVIPATGGSPMRIAADFQDARYGVWSPNGQYVLFTGCRDTSQPLDSCREWWIAGADGKRVENTGALKLLRNHGIVLLDNAVGGWYGSDNSVLFSGIRNNHTSLWELHLSSRDLRVTGPARQLTSGSNIREIDPSLADDGTLAYGHLVGAAHIWRIENPLSPGSAVATRITDDAEIDSLPYVSHNGRWLAFSGREGEGEHNRIEIRDLNLGNVVRLPAFYSDEVSPVIDDSGTTVVFEATPDHVSGIFVTVREGPARKLCSGCNTPNSWFDGSHAILYREGLPSQIKMTYLDTGESSTVLEKNGLSLANASWSPENQYLLFTAAAAGSNNRIFAVRLPSSTGKAAGSWIPITGESEWSDRPRWSGDGRIVFYVSTRDGFHCIWGQHFDPESGKTRGLPFAVMHYHNLRVSPSLVVWKNFGLSTAGDSIYLNPGEENETIWTGKLKQQTGIHFFERFWQ